MRSPSQRLLHTVLLLTALGGNCHAQTALPGTDIRSFLTADISAKLSLAGTWIPIDTGAIIVGPYYNVVKLGATQQEGVAFGGWAWNGSFMSTLADVTPVRAALLEQRGDGALADATSRLLGNAITSGAGSVIVADFNGDGLDDLVFPAHNESPFIFAHSTAYISRPGGGFDRLTLADNVMNHDARLVTLDGRKKILARSFGGSGNNGNGAGFNVIYGWTGNTLVADTSLGDLGGQSVLAGPFTGNSDNWLIVGDSAGGGPGVPYSPTNPMQNYAYKYSAGVLSSPPTLLPKPYFNDKPAYAGFVSQWDPYSKTHTSRLWTTDLNQDGLPDIVAGQELWGAAAGLQKAVFQLLVNHGNMAFTDDTDALAPEFDQNSIIDYSVRFADVDGSGIETMFHASGPAFSDASDAAKQGQYILVNDGTGRLHAAMHDEFRAMRTQIVKFLNPLIPGGGASSGITPQFVAYRNASGTLNFVAVVRYFMPNLEPKHRFAFVNVPLGINLATDFRRDLTIATRNGSKRIRTFAGNDTIMRALADPDCSIDGGLGTNKVVYPGKRAAWTITAAGDKVTVRPVSGPGGTDTLTRIQSAQFDDQVVDLKSLPSAVAANYEGMWWTDTEPGWGVTFTHQQEIIFAALYTYGVDGKPWWLSATLTQGADGSFAGDVIETAGPAYSAAFDAAKVSNRKVGSGMLTFSDIDHATFAYTANGIAQQKKVTRFAFRNPVPTCVFNSATAAAQAVNFQDMWWNPSEPGWGVTLTHQADVIFAAWYTHDVAGKAWWLSATASKTAKGVYTGDLYENSGPPFSAAPFDASRVANRPVGTVTFTFADGAAGTMAYSVGGVTKTKPIARFVFRSPGTVCQ